EAGEGGQTFIAPERQQWGGGGVVGGGGGRTEDGREGGEGANFIAPERQRWAGGGVGGEGAVWGEGMCIEGLGIRGSRDRETAAVGDRVGEYDVRGIQNYIEETRPLGGRVLYPSLGDQPDMVSL
ncbi:unnamed protein product, partial [Ectocarpus sp. 13 AM-2016]